MFRLSSKSRYGLRAVIELALHPKGEPVQVRLISERQKVSPRYIEQIFRRLKQAGLITTVRGPSGGYLLGREAGVITVLEVIQAIEGPITLCPPCSDGDYLCRAIEKCLKTSIFEKAQKTLTDCLRSTTVADLIRGIKARVGHEGG